MYMCIYRYIYLYIDIHFCAAVNVSNYIRILACASLNWQRPWIVYAMSSTISLQSVK